MEVTEIKWGLATLNVPQGNGLGKTVQYKDCILKNVGSYHQNWNWALDGTTHKPGITPEALMVVDDCDIIILSAGMQNRLDVSPKSRAYLKSIGKKYFQLQSEDAVKRYNTLARKGYNVGLLLHTTC